jgi:hypothetical protein
MEMALDSTPGDGYGTIQFTLSGEKMLSSNLESSKTVVLVMLNFAQIHTASSILLEASKIMSGLLAAFPSSSFSSSQV